MDAIEFLAKDHDAVKAVLAAVNSFDEMKAAFGELVGFSRAILIWRSGSFILALRIMSISLADSRSSRAA